ncbi:hypothetical protein [Nitrosopumilus ureiphilus]|uniref:Uncharacterized protein n=1 Tax=Nitrosopumilus ureiphilus TaxID=1470067 RepID=A0A7D5R6Z8_9ARCH|nr:hypothetical protein [Nitrosopumilus ureiphilus]QLH06379.1 hypothetical protein C5F50_04275 [Nitrosopumilus ureiphilus]
MSSFDDISIMFDTESKKLSNMINIAETKSDLSIPEIIDTYYQIINVSSMNTMLKQQISSDNQKTLLDKILEIEKMITEKFNSDIHPRIMEDLVKSIQETTRILQSGSGQKSKEDIENEAKFYEELRQKMSTKEFVEQYDKGLSND